MLTGKILNNRYKIKGIIGVGGMAYVYDADDQYLQREVAIKVLKDEFVQTGDFLEKFKLEARSAASLTDENIVGIYDVGSEFIDGKQTEYIVMEKIKGKTLKTIIEEEGPLTNEQIVNYARQIALALNEAHKKGVVHRDIKPANILINENNKVKVTDFGIARVSSKATLTYTSSILGTVHYISPEQAKGYSIDHRSDLYSLGIVIYEMATKDVPFDAETPVSIAIKHLQDQPRDVRELNDKIDPIISRIIEKLLEKDANNRYQSASELIYDLDHYKSLSLDRFSTQVHPPIKDTTKIEKNKKVAEYKSKKVNTSLENENDKSSKPWFILAGVLLIVLVASLIFAKSLRNSDDPPVEEYTIIPDVEGLSLKVAGHKLTEAGLQVEVSDEIYSADVPEGRVVQQSERPGKKVSPKSYIYLTISKGVEKARVPKVTNLELEEARALIEEKGFTIGAITKEKSKISKGTITSQSPEAYENKPLGSKIDLVVSDGEKIEKTEVPNLYGQDEATALNTLNARDLIPGSINKVFSEEPIGTVVDQSIKAGKKVNKGTAVDISISKGLEEPEPEPEPPEEDPTPNPGQNPGGESPTPNPGQNPGGESPTPNPGQNPGGESSSPNPSQGEEKPSQAPETKPSPGESGQAQANNKKFVFKIKAPSGKDEFNVKIYNTKANNQLISEKNFKLSDLTDGFALMSVVAKQDSTFRILLNNKEANINYE